MAAPKGARSVEARFDAEKTIGLDWSEKIEIAYDRKDVLLYNIGVGCTDLRFVYEKSPLFRVFPTFPVRFGGLGAWDRFPRTLAGLNIDGERYMEMVRPLPAPGKGETCKVYAQAKVCAFTDKGTGALVEFETKVTDQAGNLLCRLVNGEFYRGIEKLGDIGQFKSAGISYMDAVPVPSDRPFDLAIPLHIPVNAAHIYRLSGDYLPHHIDPAAAKRVGYDRVILHGLCTLGFVTSALLSNLCGNNVSRFCKVRMRFCKPVYLGEMLAIEVWRSSSGRAVFQVRARERDELVVNNAYFEYKEEISRL